MALPVIEVAKVPLGVQDPGVTSTNVPLIEFGAVIGVHLAVKETEPDPVLPVIVAVKLSPSTFPETLPLKEQVVPVTVAWPLTEVVP